MGKTRGVADGAKKRQGGRRAWLELFEHEPAQVLEDDAELVDGAGRRLAVPLAPHRATAQAEAVRLAHASVGGSRQVAAVLRRVDRAHERGGVVLGLTRRALAQPVVAAHLLGTRGALIVRREPPVQVRLLIDAPVHALEHRYRIEVIFLEHAVNVGDGEVAALVELLGLIVGLAAHLEGTQRRIELPSLPVHLLVVREERTLVLK